MTARLVVKVSVGAEQPERCNQGFTVAATAASVGAEVSLWLTGEASWFALPGRAEQLVLPLATPLPELLAVLLGSASVTLCGQCAARRGLGPQDVLPGVRIAGSAVFVEEILRPQVQALVY